MLHCRRSTASLSVTAVDWDYGYVAVSWRPGKGHCVVSRHQRYPQWHLVLLSNSVWYQRDRNSLGLVCHIWHDTPLPLTDHIPGQPSSPSSLACMQNSRRLSHLWKAWSLWRQKAPKISSTEFLEMMRELPAMIISPTLVNMLLEHPVIKVWINYTIRVNICIKHIGFRTIG